MSSVLMSGVTHIKIMGKNRIAFCHLGSSSPDFLYNYHQTPHLLKQQVIISKDQKGIWLVLP